MIVVENYSKTSDRFSKEKIQKMVKGLIKDKKYMQALYIALSFNIGTRISDTLDFTWEIVLSGNTFKTEFDIIEKKTASCPHKKPRHIEFSASTLKLLKMYWDATGCPTSGYLFVNKHGEKITDRYINMLLKDIQVTYLGSSRVEHCSSHSLRKAFAYDFYKTHGKNIYALNTLQKILNHSNVSITLNYLGISQKEMNKAYTTNIDLF